MGQFAASKCLFLLGTFSPPRLVNASEAFIRRGLGVGGPDPYRVYGFSLTRKSVYVVWIRLRADAIFTAPPNKWVFALAEIHLIVMDRFPKLYLFLKNFLGRSGFGELLNFP